MNIIPSLFGGTRPPLQPKGPAPFAQPPERDRLALFWWLKRNTSYTAIEHNAKLWGAFAAEWEKWLRSQENLYEHLIETYKYILDDQLNYERGLKRLRQGDRSVWNRKSSEGWLGKINTSLVNRRMEWYAEPEVIADQSGVPLSLLRAYFKAHDVAMAIPHEGWYDGMGRPYGSARSLLASLPLNPEVPEPNWDKCFAPGRRAPKDGIYEQVNAEGHIVGSMAFFIKGQPTEADAALEFGPHAWDTTQQRSSAFLWRLLWEDTRYKDGAIPDEEALYPTPEQSIATSEAVPDPSRLRCEAGEPCPREGYWFTPARSGSRRYFQQGEVMPEFSTDWGKTIWQWDERQ